MEPSWRRGAGIVAILLLILVWAVLIASLSSVVGRWPIFLQSLFYMLTGIA